MDEHGIDPIVARKTWGTLEPIHAMIYFAPEAPQRYAAAGLHGETMGYFASRAAAMGPVSAQTVVATFYNFSPRLVEQAIPAAWELATPATILRARLDAADAALRRALGDDLDTDDLRAAAPLARRAAETACEHLEGRPLFAAHTTLPWPDEPHLVLWHAQTLLREYRGDGHLAALQIEGINGLDALVLHAASGEVPIVFLQSTRGWTGDQWAEATEALRSRGLVAPDDSPTLTPALTEAGRAQRQRVEDLTDRLAVRPYRSLGEEGCTRLRALARPTSRAVVRSGLLPLGT